MGSAKKTLRSPHFWAILAIFVILITLHYPEELTFLKGLGLSSLLGLSRHTAERILFLVPIVYAGAAFGRAGGITALAVALAAMLPRAILVPGYFPDALLETCSIIIAGSLANWWLEIRHRFLHKLEGVRQELESHIEVIEENEKRVSALLAISTAVNQSLELDEVVRIAADKITETVGIDTMLLFVLEEDGQSLELRAYRGISEEFARKVGKVKLGEGFNGLVAQTGKPFFIEQSPLDPSLSPEAVSQGILGFQYICPLKSRDQVVGTLCIAVRHFRQFTSEERELLHLISLEIGIAIEKARLYHHSELAVRRYRELFEKAHDAIWVQDLEGNIITINQAGAELTGYEVEDLIGKAVTQFLTPQALSLAREIRQKLLGGETVDQPYEQQIIRKDGKQATVMLTTSVVGGSGMPQAFQHIARDVTREKQLQEALRSYIDQVSKAHDEERNHIARELHDDTTQAIVAVSHRLDSLTSRRGGKAVSPETRSSIEQIRNELDGILARLRRFIQDLRPPTLEYLGFLPALRELVSQLKKESDIQANLVVKGTVKSFTEQEELVIYRVVQEALTNTRKHSGANKVDVIIEFADDNTRVIISDDGKGLGFNQSSIMELPRRGKLGLVGMVERAHLLGGSLTIQSESKLGTTIVLDVPGNKLAA